MKPIQKKYEFPDKITLMQKCIDSVFHERNLCKIKERKISFSPFLAKPFSYSTYRHKYNPNILKSYKIESENLILSKKLTQILKKKPKAFINTSFLENNSRIQVGNSLKRKTETEQIKKENSQMFRRLGHISPFISPKMLDQDYKLNHSKLINKLKNYKAGVPNLRLPELKKKYLRKLDFLNPNKKKVFNSFGKSSSMKNMNRFNTRNISYNSIQRNNRSMNGVQDSYNSSLQKSPSCDFFQTSVLV